MTKRTLFFIILFFYLTSLCGCEAFVRKFTRKPKKDQMSREEMVLQPEEYKSTMTKDEEYRQAFLYWKSWQDELINTLEKDANYKKLVVSTEQAIENVEQMRRLLTADKQKKLDSYLNRLRGLKNLIAEDIYVINYARHKSIAERIKMEMLKDFSYGKVKDSLI